MTIANSANERIRDEKCDIYRPMTCVGGPKQLRQGRLVETDGAAQRRGNRLRTRLVVDVHFFFMDGKGSYY